MDEEVKVEDDTSVDGHSLHLDVINEKQTDKVNAEVRNDETKKDKSAFLKFKTEKDPAVDERENVSQQCKTEKEPAAEEREIISSQLFKNDRTFSEKGTEVSKHQNCEREVDPEVSNTSPMEFPQFLDVSKIVSHLADESKSETSDHSVGEKPRAFTSLMNMSTTDENVCMEINDFDSSDSAKENDRDKEICSDETSIFRHTKFQPFKFDMEGSQMCQIKSFHGQPQEHVRTCQKKKNGKPKLRTRMLHCSCSKDEKGTHPSQTTSNSMCSERQFKRECLCPACMSSKKTAGNKQTSATKTNRGKWYSSDDEEDCLASLQRSSNSGTLDTLSRKEHADSPVEDDSQLNQSCDLLPGLRYAIPFLSRKLKSSLMNRFQIGKCDGTKKLMDTEKSRLKENHDDSSIEDKSLQKQSNHAHIDITEYLSTSDSENARLLKKNHEDSSPSEDISPQKQSNHAHVDITEYLSTSDNENARILKKNLKELSPVKDISPRKQSNHALMDITEYLTTSDSENATSLKKNLEELSSVEDISPRKQSNHANIVIDEYLTTSDSENAILINQNGDTSFTDEEDKTGKESSYGQVHQHFNKNVQHGSTISSTCEKNSLLCEDKPLVESIEVCPINDEVVSKDRACTCCIRGAEASTKWHENEEVTKATGKEQNKMPKSISDLLSDLQKVELIDIFLSDTEENLDKQSVTSSDSFLKNSNSESTSDSGEADDEFECDCPACQSLGSRSQQEGQSDLQSDHDERHQSNGNPGSEAEFQWTAEGDERNDAVYWSSDSESEDENYRAASEPLEEFVYDIRREMEEGFERILQEMLQLHPELMTDSAPPPANDQVIERLSEIVVSRDMIDDKQSCPICLAVYVVEEIYCTLPCGHLFHHVCIKAWLTKSGTCPVCRRKL